MTKLLLALSLAPLPQAVANWQACGTKLMLESGISKYQATTAPFTYSFYSVSIEEDFLEKLMAVMYVESNFNPKATSKKEAVGLMQLTQPALEDAIRHCSLPNQDLVTMYFPRNNIKYGSCYLNHLWESLDKDWVRTLVTYNGGYRQLARYDQGLELASETANYLVKIHQSLSLCKL